MDKNKPNIEEALKRIKEAKETGATELDLSDLNLTSLPDELFELESLEKLFLGHNRLISIPADILKLHQLIELDLDSNLLTDIPDFIIELKHLQVFYSSFNDVSYLSDNIKNLIPKLRDSSFFFNPSYLDLIHIKNYFSLKNIQLDNLKNFKEVYFLGENGDGKTLLLQSIALALVWESKEINGLTEEAGKLISWIENRANKFLNITIIDSMSISYEINREEKKIIGGNFHNYFFAYGVNRTRRNSEEFIDKTGFMTLFKDDQYLLNPIDWLKEVDRKEKYGYPISLDTAKKLLCELLDNNVKIVVNPQNGDIFFLERETELEFDQLSDGYKSVLIWVTDLVARLAERQPHVKELKDFKGIVLVDEIDLYLHPKWAFSLVKKLRTWFPQIQFFFTTHNPVVILGASEEAVFYRVYKENGETKVSEPYFSKDLSHLMANGILTSPLVDLESARMASFGANNEPLDTNNHFHYSRIEKKIQDSIALMKQKGKVYFSPQEIDNLVAEALEDYKTNDKDK